MIIHLHIPKCGGTSLLDILNSHYNVTRLSNEGGWRQFDATSAQNVGDCLSGHMPYGLHRHFSEPCDYITFLRHPVDRLMSFYYYVVGRRGKSMWSSVIGNMSLDEFIDSDLHDNDMVRYISGSFDVGYPRSKKMTTKDLDQAIDNIEKFRFVGDVSDYTSEVKRMASELDITIDNVPHMLKSDNRGYRSLDSATLDMALARTELDMELYHHALRQRYPRQ